MVLMKVKKDVMLTKDNKRVSEKEKEEEMFYFLHIPIRIR